MIRRGNSWMVMLVAVFGLAACGGDAADATSEAVAQTADEANPCAAADETMDHDAMDGGEMQELPEGVTMAMIEDGEAIYGGAGICSSCHAPTGAGIPNLGADLTDDEWTHSDGSYEGIVATVMNGVTADASTSGVPMPAKAGTSITDDQVRAVSAYVWTLSK